MLIRSCAGARCNTRVWSVMVRPFTAALLVGASLILQVAAVDDHRCDLGVNCQQDCKPESPTYKPQRCDECCESPDGSDERKDPVFRNDRLRAMETVVGELRVMTGVLLMLVVLLLVAVVGLFLYFTNSLPKLHIPVLFRNKNNNNKEASHKPCNGIDHNSTIVRIANYPSNHCPIANRSSVNMSGKGPTEDTVEPPEFLPRPYRVRQPSESTCPEEGSDLPQHAYDNLALSTSTLHNTSNSSTDTLAAAVSTNTMETTLPSVNNLHSINGEITRV